MPYNSWALEEQLGKAGGDATNGPRASPCPTTAGPSQSTRPTNGNVAPPRTPMVSSTRASGQLQPNTAQQPVGINGRRIAVPVKKGVPKGPTTSGAALNSVTATTSSPSIGPKAASSVNCSASSAKSMRPNNPEPVKQTSKAGGEPTKHVTSVPKSPPQQKPAAALASKTTKSNTSAAPKTPVTSQLNGHPQASISINTQSTAGQKQQQQSPNGAASKSTKGSAAAKVAA